MSKVRVQCFGISIDGYSAGPNQSLENPLGAGGTGVMEWAFPTQTMRQKVFGQEGGGTGVDDDFVARGFANIGAWILGRNMFGPIRGPWGTSDWKGWWGDEPPYHCDVFVLTHYAREAIAMQGGTVFHFITEGIESALEQAKAAAQSKDIRIGGGVATVRQYLEAGFVDEIHLAQAPVVLGGGETLFHGLDLSRLGYRCVERAPSQKATHIVLARTRDGAS